jgi:hypothetical protein
MKHIFFVSLLCSFLFGATAAHAEGSEAEGVSQLEAERRPIAALATETKLSTKGTAQAAAVADSVSTLVGIANGARELNPLVSTSPVGLIALAGVKFYLVHQADSMPKEKRERVLRTYSSFWGGASASNLLIAASVAPPVALAAGLATAYVMWQRSKNAKAEGTDVEVQPTVLAMANVGRTGEPLEMQGY